MIAKVAWGTTRTWTTPELPWLRAELRRGYEGAGNATRPLGDTLLPWDQPDAEALRLHGHLVYPTWKEVGEPVFNAVLRTSAGDVVIGAN